ncbi:MAG: T9SS type A sorting domain-containing protein [bacterium]
MSVFHSADDIIDSVTISQNWWVRRHSIEVIMQLFTKDTPSLSWDDVFTFNKLKAEVQPRWSEFITILQNISENDDCIYVRESAENIYKSIKMPDIVKCVSSEIIDSSGIINVKLFWNNQNKDITNYWLKVYKIGNFDAILVISDSTITDTSYTTSYLGNGHYEWLVSAENQFGRSEWDERGCEFSITTSDIQKNNQPPNFNITITPNIIETNAKIDFFLPQNSNMEISVMDIFGNVVIEITNKFYLSGENQEMLNVENFASGYYLLVLKVNSNYHTKPFILMK